MRWTPHALIEGTAIGAYAIGAETCVHLHPRRVHRAAARDGSRREGGVRRRASSARTRWAAGKRMDVHVHRGAGAYICGEETALMNSLEGRRGNPRIKPPFPGGGRTVRPADDDQQRRDARRGAAHPEQRRRVVQGDVACRIRRARARSSSRCAATSRVPATTKSRWAFRSRISSTTSAAARCPGRKFKAVIPGGSSVPIQTMEEAESTLMDYEGFVAQGTMLGSGGVIVFDDSQCMVKHIARARALLRARELRAVHAVPRGHRVDDEDPGAHRGGRRHDAGLRHAAGARRQHDGQDDLRAERFVRGAGRVGHSEVPRTSSRRTSRASAVPSALPAAA